MTTAPFISVPDYQGVTVICSADVWDSKIVRHHPELTDREQAVRDAIAQPELVLQDRDYPDRKHHIRRLPDGRFVDVVTAYQYETAARILVSEVITAFLRKRLRRGDTVLYEDASAMEAGQ